MAKENSYKPLSWKHSSHAVAEADHIIKEGMSGEQLVLFSRHEKIKKALLGGWRFNNNYAICGASGSGKSYYLNMLYQDFLNKNLNRNFKKPFVILHFCFEMSAYDEVLRAATGIVGYTYRELLSTDRILTTEEYQNVRTFLDDFRECPIYYVESTGNVGEMEATIDEFHKEFPNHELIVGVDHTLLADYEDEKGEVELVTNESKMLVRVRKRHNSMNLEVVQLNADIEELERINKPIHHYPKKKDIHGAKAVFRDADYVIVLHAPEKLGIERYGPKKYPTKGLIAWHQIKARKGTLGLIRLKDELDRGNIREWCEADDIELLTQNQ
jgi:KaiC/GvpD/RAD55 family RecA-like ATPase